MDVCHPPEVFLYSHAVVEAGVVDASRPLAAFPHSRAALVAEWEVAVVADGCRRLAAYPCS